MSKLNNLLFDPYPYYQATSACSASTSHSVSNFPAHPSTSCKVTQIAKHPSAIPSSSLLTMEPNSEMIQTIILKAPSKSSAVTYTTFYSPSWTAFRGTSAPHSDLGPGRSQSSQPAQEQSIQSADMNCTSGGTTYSDYSTPPRDNGPFAPGAKQN